MSMLQPFLHTAKLVCIVFSLERESGFPRGHINPPNCGISPLTPRWLLLSKVLSGLNRPHLCRDLDLARITATIRAGIDLIYFIAYCRLWAVATGYVARKMYCK